MGDVEGLGSLVSAMDVPLNGFVSLWLEMRIEEETSMKDLIMGCGYDLEYVNGFSVE